MHPDGTPHEMTQLAKRFGNQLNGRFNLPVTWVDERYSSVEAEATIARQQGPRRYARRRSRQHHPSAISWTDFPIPMSSIDAEALYRALVDQIRAAHGDKLGAARRRRGRRAGRHLQRRRMALPNGSARDLNLASFGVVNVALHRDDYAKKGLHSQASPTSLPFFRRRPPHRSGRRRAVHRPHDSRGAQ